MLGVGVGLAAMVVALALMAYVKTHAAASAIARIAAAMERSTKRVAAVALVPGAVIALWLASRGIAPPPAIVVGMLAAFGVFALALALFKMEGVLVETGSAFRARVAAGAAPPTSRLGRVLWSGVGIVALAGTLAALHVVTR